MADCRARGKRKASVPSGATGEREDRTGELLEPSLMSRDGEPCRFSSTPHRDSERHRVDIGASAIERLTVQPGRARVVVRRIDVGRLVISVGACGRANSCASRSLRRLCVPSFAGPSRPGDKRRGAGGSLPGSAGSRNIRVRTAPGSLSVFTGPGRRRQAAPTFYGMAWFILVVLALVDLVAVVLLVLGLRVPEVDPSIKDDSARAHRGRCGPVGQRPQSSAPAPQSKPVTHASRLVTHKAPSVAFGLGWTVQHESAEPPPATGPDSHRP